MKKKKCSDVSIWANAKEVSRKNRFELVFSCVFIVLVSSRDACQANLAADVFTLRNKKSLKNHQSKKASIRS